MRTVEEIIALAKNLGSSTTPPEGYFLIKRDYSNQEDIEFVLISEEKLRTELEDGALELIEEEYTSGDRLSFRSVP